MFSLLNGRVSATNGHQSTSPSAPALSDELSIDGFIRGRTWLITGVTGFMGTVLVSLTSAARITGRLCLAAEHMVHNVHERV